MTRKKGREYLWLASAGPQANLRESRRPIRAHGPHVEEIRKQASKLPTYHLLNPRSHS